MQPLNIILFGKAGSGKGTQAQLLVEKYKLRLISTGDLLREHAKGDLPIARRLSRVLNEGLPAPSWLVFSMWIREVEKVSDAQGILFEGAARRLPEAKLLEEVMEWYERPVIAFLLELSDEEAIRRMSLRKRHDDTEAAMRKRLSWFPTEVVPVIEYYTKKGIVTRINGEQSVEAVHREILSRLPSPQEVLNS